MATVESYAHGAFCWCEESTTDQQAAKDFYCKTFGWSFNDSEYGPGQYYTMFASDDLSVAGMSTLDEAQRANGVPSHWNIYINVDNVDTITTRAADLGGTVLAPAFDVMSVGRMSIVQDPGGAIIMFWQKGDHVGAQRIEEPGGFCWYELATKSVDASRAFYTALLGWTTKDSPEYTEFQLNGQSIGGMMNIPDVPPNWMPYIMVADVEATIAAATANGGTLLMGPGAAGEWGIFAVLIDPTGATFGIFQSKR